MATWNEPTCERCGKPLGPERYLSKWPVCGRCTRDRHAEAVGRQPKRAPKVARGGYHAAK